jgi:hypothetical protein
MLHLHLHRQTLLTSISLTSRQKLYRIPAHGCTAKLVTVRARNDLAKRYLYARSVKLKSPVLRSREVEDPKWAKGLYKHDHFESLTKSPVASDTAQ